jgi:hypothetical protein
MAKRRQGKRSATAFAEGLGAAFGKIAGRIDAWNSQRGDIAKDIQDLITQAQRILKDVMRAPAPVVPGTRKGKGGRPKGYKMSAATKAKLRAAWKRRKAAKASGS